MPRYAARLGREADGSWMAAAIEFPNTWSRGRTRDEALARLRDEIRLRLEFCPCSGVEEDFVQVEVAGQPPAALRPPRPEPTPEDPAVFSRRRRLYRWDD